MEFSVFIDESGDTGIKSVRSDGKPGASPYFVMAAAVMTNAAGISAGSLLSAVEEQIPKKSWVHATDLSHQQTVFFARASTQINCRYFAVISNKETLRDYGDSIQWDPHMFYNKCAAYLLECVGKYLVESGLVRNSPNVIFESRNHNFDALMRYVDKIKRTPLHERARYLSVFNPFAFVTRAKSEERLLKFADLAAHAAYQCVNKTPNNFNIPESRYLAEMSRKFGCDDRGRVLGDGIKCIHSLKDLRLDEDVARFLSGLRATPRPIASRRG